MYVVAVTDTLIDTEVYWSGTGFTEHLNRAKVYDTITDIINNHFLLGEIRCARDREDFRVVEVDIVKNIRKLKTV